MDKQTQRDIAYAMMAERARRYESSEASFKQKLANLYNSCQENGHSPIASAILALESISFSPSDQVFSKLENLTRYFSDIDNIKKTE